ncbi:hypothetical protein L1787_22195 [Acuticoccus sp. M5D2P5]|uniref:hypothetical protein n=1 Tax=Acuticoccus kalidii TaxID=2910977 RepID=UPI001F462AF1|nr:hypothetical protein [Acuticoccus kalidii]MCF3936106.1 hypothetical protein [Acuticoccus kalidii]
MTFAVCKRVGNELCVHADSPLPADVIAKFEANFRQSSILAGLLETVILHPHACLSTAGRTVETTEFLKHYFAGEPADWDTPRVLRALFDIHMTSRKTCEFILCESIRRVPRVFVIKGGSIEKDVPNAWIGSPRAFTTFQTAYDMAETPDIWEKLRASFRAVAEEDERAKGGHLHIEVFLDHRGTGYRNDAVFSMNVRSASA